MAEWNTKVIVNRTLQADFNADMARQQVEDLSKVLDISRRIQVEKDLDRLLELIMAETTQVLDCERSSLFLVDDDAGELYSKVAEGEAGEIRFPMSTGLAGACARTNESINIPDAYADKRFNPQIDKQTGFKTRSILCFPLTTSEGKVVGVMQSLNKRKGPFTDYDEALLAAFSQQAAIALDSARLAQAYLEKEKLKRSMEIARDIQQSLMPRSDPEIDLLDIASFCQSCDETGGDYYDYIRLGDDHLGLAIGDVSGHGLGAALFMGMARSLLRSFAYTIGNPAKILAQMNDPLEGDMGADSFMTLFYGVLDIKQWRLDYASGGHDEPLIYRVREKRFEELEATGIPIGMIGGQDFPLAPAVKFDPGDVLVLATDGLWEAMNGAGEPFGRDRMKQVIVDHAAKSAREIVTALREVCEKHVDTPVPKPADESAATHAPEPAERDQATPDPDGNAAPRTVETATGRFHDDVTLVVIKFEPVDAALKERFIELKL